MKKVKIKAHTRSFNASKLPPRTAKGKFTTKGPRQRSLFK